MLLNSRTVKKKNSSTKLSILAPTNKPVVPPTETKKRFILLMKYDQLSRKSILSADVYQLSPVDS